MTRTYDALMTWLAIAVAAFFVVSPAYAQKITVPATLIAETQSPAPGQNVTLAILFKPEKGWHGYWINPGDAGQGLRLEWRLSDGVKAAPPQFPVPETLLISGLMNHVYEHDHAVLVDLSIPAGLAKGTAIPVRVHAEWLACTDTVCSPQSGDLSVDLVVGDGKIAPNTRKQFDTWRAALAQPSGGQGSYAVSGDAIRIAIPYPADAPLDQPHLFAATDGMMDYAAPQRFYRHGDMVIVESKAGFDPASPKAMDALLKIAPGRGLMVHAVPGDVPTTGSQTEVGSGAGARNGMTLMGILAALGAAILGGLLLNIMPCVFPILSLKALSLAKAGGDERGAKRDALAYTTGVVLTCLALGGLLLALRAGGAQVGWSFQLQDARVIALLFFLTTAITLNLAGWFNLGSITAGHGLTQKSGWAGSFWTGALAAFMATPCSGPFMAAALGAALVLPAPVAMAIFAGLGLGIALPFLLVGFVPAIRSRLPKPGPWMEKFRRWMAVPMALTVLAIGWVLWWLRGWPGVIWAVGAAIFMTLILLWASRLQRKGRAIWLPLIPAALLAIAAAWTLPIFAPPVKRVAESPLPNAAPFTEARLNDLRAEKRPVFVYFTASWCMTCKVNERGALASDKVAQHFRDKNIGVLVGDWSEGDPDLTRFMSRFGRSDIPFYLYYPADGSAPKMLPQLLTDAELTGL